MVPVKAPEPHGFVVVLLDADGPRGAWWCATAEEAELVYNEELAKGSVQYPMQAYRRAEMSGSSKRD